MFEILSASEIGASILLDIRTDAVAISALTRYEMLNTRNKKSFERMKRLLANLPVLPYTEECADASAKIATELAQKGKMISYHDVHIAGTCINEKMTLVTLDKHFERIPNLSIKKLKAL